MATIAEGLGWLHQQRTYRDVTGVVVELPSEITRMEMRVYLTHPAVKFGPAIGYMLNDGIWWEISAADGSVIFIMIEKWQHQVGITMLALTASTKVDMRDREMFTYRWKDGVATITSPRGGEKCMEGTLDEIRAHVQKTHVGYFTQKPEVFE